MFKFKVECFNCKQSYDCELYGEPRVCRDCGSNFITVWKRILNKGK